MIKRMAEKMQTIHNSCFGNGQDHIKDVYDYINQLEADKLEAYRAIVEFNRMYKFETGEEILKGSVLKAEKYISEVEK